MPEDVKIVLTVMLGFFWFLYLFFFIVVGPFKAEMIRYILVLVPATMIWLRFANPFKEEK